MERGDVGGGGMAPRGGVVGSAAMLGLDMHLAPQAQHQQQMHPAVAFQHQVHPAVAFQPHLPVPVRQQQQPTSTFSPYSNSNTSSDRVVVASAAAAVGNANGDDLVGNGNGGFGGKGGGAVVQQPHQPQAQQLASVACPWTRMKWTDEMVRLLINVVYSVGDDGEGAVAAAAAGGGGNNKAGRAGSSSSAAHQQQQKKGKWKSVSHAMKDRSFVVSPQQCEDKFNDLNKRYKRVVDLLGRGRACRVVDNHALLDAIDDLTPKAKDEARKLLGSKHLFFREMCAYHNAGGGGGSQLTPHAAGGDCLYHPPPPATFVLPAAAAAASSAARHPHPQQQQHAAALSSPAGMKDSSTDVADGEDQGDSYDDAVSDYGDEEGDYDDGEEEDGRTYQTRRRRSRQQHSGGRSSKRGRGEDLEAAAVDPSAVLQKLKGEVAAGPAAGMDPQQVRCWVRRRAVEVEEQQVLLESRTHDMETQRLKWERFRATKERDMERDRLRNDRLLIESRRMLLVLRRRDVELDVAAEANSSSVDVDHHHQTGAAHQQQQQQTIGSSPPSTAGHPN